ncbi:MAG: hypothetical protein QME71_04185 [Dehalococcoidia bacterium]|nr:hypothetical protein [Dehalococcoidia bacterium]
MLKVKHGRLTDVLVDRDNGALTVIVKLNRPDLPAQRHPDRYLADNPRGFILTLYSTGAAVLVDDDTPPEITRAARKAAS